MKGKNIIVTGASRGIGNGIAKHLLQLGANVVLVARNEDQLFDLKKKYPQNAFPYAFDLSNIDDIEKIFKYAKENNLKLDGLVHAAGISADWPIRNLDIDALTKTMNINFFSYALLGRYFISKKYTNQGASMIGFSSIASLISLKGQAIYSASKSAVNSFTETMSKEAAPRKIRVNAIAPAFVDTDMFILADNLHDDLEGDIRKTQEFGVIPVEQIAFLAEFLLSDKAKYITGAIIPVWGGSGYA